MCGIVGYVGYQQAAPFLLQGLRRLEYRGYDSAGLATIVDSQLCVRRAVGRIRELTLLEHQSPASGQLGIGHTRWATHGDVELRNTHPHTGGQENVAVVHNGVIENHLQLRRELQSKGVVFESDTDSEVIAQLIASYYEHDLSRAVRQALSHLQGTYAIAVISPRQPDVLVGARMGSPLVLGLGDRESFLASDTSALNGNVHQVVYLEDGQWCVLRSDEWSVLNHSSERVTPRLHPLHHSEEDLETGIYPHFMLKEIHEQPRRARG